MRRIVLGIGIWSCVLAACSDGRDGTSGSGTGSSGGATSGSQCETSSATCECIELAPGGVKVCKQPPIEATSCNDGEPPDACCTSADCATGKCYGYPVAPVCSGANEGDANACASDECASDADCPEGRWCLPAGVLGYKVSRCVFGCRHDADCSDKPGGVCVIEPSTTCCGDSMPRCRYPDTPPVSDECPP